LVEQVLIANAAAKVRRRGRASVGEFATAVGGVVTKRGHGGLHVGFFQGFIGSFLSVEGFFL
jgi:hypothetical protein